MRFLTDGKQTAVRRLTASAMVVALGLVLQLIESMVPLPIDLPGGKLGLANMAVMTILPLLPAGAVIAVSLTRALLGSLLFGGGLQMAYAAAGALASSLMMTLAYHRFSRVGFPGVGMFGAAAHNAAQVLTAVLLFRNVYLFSYLSVLLVLSVLTGGFTGYAVGWLYKGEKR